MEGIMVALTLITFVTLTLIATADKANGDRDYHQGWADHAALMKAYEESPDDEALLKEMKRALKAYIRAEKLHRKGDSGRIDKTTDWKEFKDVAWNTTVRRREMR